MHHDMWHFGWMWIFWILVIAVVVWVGVTALWSIGRRSNERAEPPEAALKRRYARGEIGKDEYERRLADIHG